MNRLLIQIFGGAACVGIMYLAGLHAWPLLLVFGGIIAILMHAAED